MPTDRWLKVWCIWHTYLETLQECRSRRRIGWIIQDFRETCVSHSLTFCLETKMPWRQTPHERRKPSCLQMWRRALVRINYTLDFQKYVKYLKYVREFHTSVCYCGDISTPQNVMLKETICDWLFDMSGKRPHGRALANETCHLFQSEGLATRD